VLDKRKADSLSGGITREAVDGRGRAFIATLEIPHFAGRAAPFGMTPLRL
jgi:hypothetical protein